MRSLTEYLLESINSTDSQVIDDTIVEGVVQLILTNKANKNDIDKLKDKIAIYKPKNEDEFRAIVKTCIDIDPNCSLNWIDTSEIDNMSRLFAGSSFNGDISKWDVSNVKYTVAMFHSCSFNGDISKWKFKKIKEVNFMFVNCPIERNHEPNLPSRVFVSSPRMHRTVILR